MREGNSNRVAVFTGNRAGFGYLFPLILKLKDCFEIELFVSGAHLLPPWNTINEIEEKLAEYKIKCIIHRIKLNDLKDPYKESLGRIYGYSIKHLNNKFKFSIVMGDRIEPFSFALASFFMNVPVAHINGGDITNVPYFDTSIRHSITKIAHLHFVNNVKSGRVIEQMGEEKWRIHNIGTLSYDYNSAGMLPGKTQLSKELSINPTDKFILFTYHSAHSKSPKQNLDEFKMVLNAVRKTSLKIIMTYPNNDPGSKLLLPFIQNMKQSEKIKIIPNLGTERILSLYKNFHVIVAGNSSGGLIETCLYKIPALNIGCRQVDRFRGNNVFDCEIDKNKIYDKLNYIINNYERLKKGFDKYRYFFGNGHAASKALKVLKKYQSVGNEILLFKKFVIK